MLNLMEGWNKTLGGKIKGKLKFVKMYKET